MIATKQEQDLYLKRYREFEKRLSAKSPTWLARLRTEAIESFAELGFPTPRNEDWKYTNVAPIARTAFVPAEPATQGEIAGEIKQSPFADLGCPRLVFVNGRFAPDLSSLEGLIPEVKVLSLAEAIERGDAGIEEYLARYADFKAHPFVALNTAFIEDGACIEIPKGLVVEKPIYLLYTSSNPGQPAVTHPRNLILAGRESQATILEGHLGAGGQTYFTNAVTEVVVGENAVVDYVKLQQEGESAFHIATLKFHQARSARAHATSVAIGARLAREEAVSVLDGEGGEGTLNGIYVLTGQQHVDNHTTLDHVKPHCSSREIYKGILDGKSTGVFNGKIIVRPDAQKTDSKQSNKNLLLSEDATINTKPQLEIYADDVKCTHGATIGQIDAEALFYMRSRGIGLEPARNLLTVAFVNDVLDKIRYEPLRDKLKSAIFARLAKKTAAA